MIRNYQRQGVTIDGIDVVLVAATTEQVDELRGLVEFACREHGSKILLRSTFPAIGGDPVLTQPIIDIGVTPHRMIGYVELADG